MAAKVDQAAVGDVGSVEIQHAELGVSDEPSRRRSPASSGSGVEVREPLEMARPASSTWV